MNLQEQLSHLIGKRLKKFSARLVQVEHSWRCDEVEVGGQFYYLKFKDGRPNTEAFVEILSHHITHFCIPRKERAKARQLVVDEDDESYTNQLYQEARDLFIKSKKALKTSGEPGEVILYMLLEALVDAPQVACKMYLKTSQNVPVHGSDGIHAKYDPQADTLRIYWGESKLYSRVGQALDEICGSIDAFNKTTCGDSPRIQDLNILKKHISIDDETLRDRLLAYFDPYEDDADRIEEHFACFVGFDYALLASKYQYSDSELVGEFEKKYKKEVERIHKAFAKKVKENKLSRLKFSLFLIPFECVDELRTQFFSKTGISV